MKRGIIRMTEGGKVSMPLIDVWMTKGEIADMFGLLEASVFRAIRSIHKKSELYEHETYPEKRIKVYFPPSNFSCDLKDNLIHHSSKPVLMYKNERRFRDAIMPDVVTDGTKRYEVPEKWRPANIVR